MPNIIQVKDQMNELSKKATKGPWRRGSKGAWEEFHHNQVFADTSDKFPQQIATIHGVPMNASLKELESGNDASRWRKGLDTGAFIAASRTAIDQFVAFVEKVQALEREHVMDDEYKAGYVAAKLAALLSEEIAP